MRNLSIPDDNCSIFDCYSSRAAAGISFFRIPAKNDDKIKLEEQHCCSYYPCAESNLKRQIKNGTLHTTRLFLLTKSLSSKLSISGKLLQLIPILLFRYLFSLYPSSYLAYTHPLIHIV